MKCYFHPTEDAVATCMECGMAMCEKCFNASEGSGLCPACRIEEIKSERAKVKKSGSNKLLSSILWGMLMLAITVGVVVALMFFRAKITSFFAPHGKIAFIVIACIAGSIVVALLMNTVSSAVKAHAFQKADDKLEYTQRKLSSLIRVATKQKSELKQTEKNKK